MNIEKSEKNFIYRTEQQQDLIYIVAIANWSSQSIGTEDHHYFLIACQIILDLVNKKKENIFE
jgi:hypothetical protein